MTRFITGKCLVFIIIDQISGFPLRFRNLSALADLEGWGAMGEGLAERTHAPFCQNFFIFKQFWGKTGQIIGWRLQLENLYPPLQTFKFGTFLSEVQPI